MSEQGVRPLVDAVLAGENIDWAHVEARYRGNTTTLYNLRAIDRIAHQTRSASFAAAANKPSPHAVLARPFVSALLLLVTAQIGAGIVGYFSGEGRTFPISASAAIITVGVFATAAAWLLIGGGNDDRAVNLGVFFLLVAAAFCRRFITRSPALAPLFKGVFPDAFLAVFLWKFVRQFPRAVRSSWTDSLCGFAESVSLVIGITLFAANLLLSRGVSFVPAALHRSSPSGLYWTLLLGVTIPVPVIIVLRALRSPPSEQRRIMLFAISLAVVLAPTLVETVAEASFPSFATFMAQPRIRGLASPIFFGLLLTVPVTTTYTVMVQTVLDVRIAIGRALQYVLARNTARVLTLIPLVVLVVYEYFNRNQTVTQLFSNSRGFMAVATLLAAVVMSLWRERALSFVDVWFLRQHVDLAGELITLTGRLGTGRSVIELAELMERELSRILNLRKAVFFKHVETEPAFVAVRRDEPPLSGDGALGAMLAAARLAIPIRADSRQSLLSLLPFADRQWLETSESAAVVPLSGRMDTLLGFVALGPKRNEDFFSREELSFVTAAGAACALAVETRQALDAHVVGTSRAEPEPGAECIKCGRIDGHHESSCLCGGQKRTASVPIQLAGKFEVDRYVGAGAMGVVYRAYDVALGRSVALKTLSRITGDAARRLAREARIMAAVAHPNLATIYSVETWRETPILVLEFLDGGSLATRLKDRQPIRGVLQLGVLLAPALEQLHLAGILHGDIKPSNIGFSREGVPKMLDFGLASLLPEARVPGHFPALGTAAATATQSVVVTDRSLIGGTPLYLSPEALAGAPASEAFDIWALAFLLYEAIAGQHPFSAPTADEVLRNVRRAYVPDLREFRSDCPAAVSTAFRSMLSSDQARRPQTATEFRRVLDQLAREFDEPVRT